ncbi:MAG: ribosome assembly RNA-binding protein YhbY [Clostridia bacterium]|nr:ribosome assembly RNA-binding protein YhbY [Clostridia bacterium]
MTSKQRAYLRGLANPLTAILQVGKNGLNDNLIKQVEDALEARELIKLSVLETAPEDNRTIAETLASSTNSVLVQVVGNKITLYRAKKKNPKIQLPEGR